MDARRLFLADHAMVHSAAVAPAEGLNIPDLSNQLPDELLRTAPPGLNSIAWLLWHMARTEDIAVNGVLRETLPVLERDGWSERLGIDTATIGTGDSSAQTAHLNRDVDLDALKAYRDAVGRETRAFVSTVDFDTLAQPIRGGDRGSAAGAFGPNAAWVQQFWQGRSGVWFLVWLGIGHNYMHLGEAGVISRALGVPGG